MSTRHETTINDERRGNAAKDIDLSFVSLSLVSDVDKYRTTNPSTVSTTVDLLCRQSSRCFFCFCSLSVDFDEVCYSTIRTSRVASRPYTSRVEVSLLLLNVQISSTHT